MGNELLQVFFAVIHWPLNALPYYFPRFFFAAAAAVILGYWIFIGVTAGFLLWLFHDCRVRGFRRRRMLLVCGGWVLGTFALHCWVLHALAGMPGYESEKWYVEEQTMALNSLLFGHAGSLEDAARARAAMQMQMPPGRGVTVPSVEQKLAIALKFQENQLNYVKEVAAMADNVKRRTVRRAWISWATTAFIPLILFAFFDTRTRRLVERPHPGAPPNAAQPHQ
jgi:hypothetical protein